MPGVTPRLTGHNAHIPGIQSVIWSYYARSMVAPLSVIVCTMCTKCECYTRVVCLQAQPVTLTPFLGKRTSESGVTVWSEVDGTIDTRAFLGVEYFAAEQDAVAFRVVSGWFRFWVTTV